MDARGDLVKRHFASDNQASIHPKILQALQEANSGHQMSYGGDPYTEKAEHIFKDLFGEQTQALFVFNGTAANVLSLRALLQPYESILCSDVAHLHEDECGAPEFFCGSKIIPVPSTHGKISIEALNSVLRRAGDVHYPQPRVLSLTQPTEMGTVYTVSEIGALSEWAKSHHLLLHVDGARLCNSVISLKTDFKTLITENGVDAVSFGGTKNGLMLGEAILVFDRARAHALRAIRKQSAQLPSKGRYIACQFQAYLESGLWKELAQHSLDMAQRLSSGVRQHPGIKLEVPVESNAVFPQIPKTWLKPLREHSFFYVWDEKESLCRWMCSWDTELADVEAFVQKVLSMK